MKKQNLYLLLFSVLAACTDIDTTQVGADNADHQVTACIRSISCGPRVSDDKTQTTFQTGDTILIGWGATAYRYSYSGSEGLFTPADNDAKGLWSKLIANGSTKVDVYAWYDPNATSSPSTLPADKSTLSVKTDQSTEENYMSGLYMAAHQQVEATASTLEFTFQHLVSRIRLSIDFNDKAIEESDIQDAVVKMRLYASAFIGKDQTSKDYQLTVPSSPSGTADDITFFTTTEVGTSHLDCICLLPPQNLDEKNPITIVLGKGKEYTCTLDKSLALSAGQEVALSIKIETEGTDIYKPVVTAIPKTELSSYYGNRLLCAKQDSDADTLRRLYVYEKQADDSWGNPMRICESFESKEALALPTIKCLDICRDYVALGTLDTPQVNEGQIYFCKRDKNSGKWYKVAGPISRNSYAIAINEHFLVAGAAGNNVTIYPITEKGEFDSGHATQTRDFAGFKLRLADNDVVCSSTSLYQLTLNNDGYVDVVQKAAFNDVNRASSSDGKKVILQTDGSQKIKIYNIDTGKEENIDNPPTAGVGLPVAIYGDYALAGGGADDDCGNSFNGQQVNWLVLLYYNGTKWIRIGAVDDPDSFLKLLKTYTSDETIQNVTSLAGTGIVMKGTRASITSEGVTYFVENIDKIVDAWLADNP